MSDSFVSLAAFTHLHEAQEILEQFKEASIAAFLAGELMAGTFPGAAGLGPQIRLMVAREDTKRALDLLTWLGEQVAMPAGWEENFPTEEGYWICAGCDEAVEEQATTCPYCHSSRNER